ncbi:MAG: hypothetical protein M1837_003734 [Sclerophora amabilis]|nr:MAG: hypothetical protein M1837_003734 [Sclerophora amabilis]
MASAAVHPGNSLPLAEPAAYHPTTTTPTATTQTSPAREEAPVKTKHHVPTTLNYYKDPGDGSEPEPAYVDRPRTYDQPKEQLDVTVNDIRGDEERYSLDGIGFQIYPHASIEKDFFDDDKIKREYYPETEQLLKDATGASRVFIFDHTIRRPSTSGANPVRDPVRSVHIDQSYTASLNRVSHHLPDLAPTLLKGRVQIINVWRPIHHPILKDPLAVADAHSVPEADLVPVGLIYPDRRGETMTVKPNKAHKWHYLYGQTPEEVLLIKCFDTKTDGRARRVPHTAFVNEETVRERPRESIEVRALVFHEDDTA